MINSVEVAGEISRDIKGGVSASGNTWANTSLKVPCGTGNRFVFISIVGFGDVAEAIMAKDKGDMLHVKGQMSSSGYEKDGVKKWEVQIVVSQVMGSPGYPVKSAPKMTTEVEPF